MLLSRITLLVVAGLLTTEVAISQTGTPTGGMTLVEYGVMGMVMGFVLAIVNGLFRLAEKLIDKNRPNGANDATVRCLERVDQSLTSLLGFARANTQTQQHLEKHFTDAIGGLGKTLDRIERKQNGKAA